MKAFQFISNGGSFTCNSWVFKVNLGMWDYLNIKKGSTKFLNEHNFQFLNMSPLKVWLTV